jgi:hypothetical protein
MWAYIRTWALAFCAVLIAWLLEVSSRINVDLASVDLSCRFSELAEYGPNTDLRDVYVPMIMDVVV